MSYGIVRSRMLLRDAEGDYETWIENFNNKQENIQKRDCGIMKEKYNSIHGSWLTLKQVY